MNARLQTEVKVPPPSSFTPVRSGLSRRTCATNGAAGLSDECDACRTKRPSMTRRASTEQAQLSEVSPVVHDVLRSPGQPLDPKTRAFMEPRFGHDFSRVRVHTDEKAAESARTLNALAYTAGRDVVFGTSQYAPETGTGQRALAHELMHVVQQQETEPRSLSPVTSDVHEHEAHRASAAIASQSPRPVPRTAAGPVGGVQRISPADSGTTPQPGAEPPVFIRDNPQKVHYSPCGEFEWLIKWETNGRGGYIVQEIHSTETILDSKGHTYKETNPDPYALETKLPPLFWEAWNVNKDGRFYPEDWDDWTKVPHPNTTGRWAVNSTVHWAPNLDPGANFGTGTVVRRNFLPSTTTKPKNLSPTLLTRGAAGKWDCTNGKNTHEAA